MPINNDQEQEQFLRPTFEITYFDSAYYNDDIVLKL
jgi:hypothetical protein